MGARFSAPAGAGLDTKETRYACFTAGGELIDGKAGNANGDMTGTGIKGGVSRMVKPGDVVFVPAGVPHYFSEIPDHVTQILVRWDVK